MRAQLRIVAGIHRGRKLQCEVTPELRPTPDRVRGALFSILGGAVPDRPFFDVFAGSGIVGLEALSRGAASATFLERDLSQAKQIENHLRTLGFEKKGHVTRADAYRWAEAWPPPAEPVNVFVSPPFTDLENRSLDMLRLLETLQAKLPPGSVLTLQSERNSALEGQPFFAGWDERHYGRNVLLFWEPAINSETQE